MKNKAILGLFSLTLILSGCANKPVYEPMADQGIVCRPYQGSEEGSEPKKQTCISVDYDTNPVRFHRVTPWELEQLPSMPDTN